MPHQPPAHADIGEIEGQNEVDGRGTGLDVELGNRGYVGMW